jgi:hypothetical protein
MYGNQLVTSSTKRPAVLKAFLLPNLVLPIGDLPGKLGRSIHILYRVKRGLVSEGRSDVVANLFEAGLVRGEEVHTLLRVSELTRREALANRVEVSTRVKQPKSLGGLDRRAIARRFAS